MKYKYAILQFSSKDRYAIGGISAVSIPEKERVIVHMKEETIKKAGFVDRYCKIEMKNEKEALLIDLLGAIGSYESELQFYQFLFGIKPCKYPRFELPIESCEMHRIDIRTCHVFSVDNPGTKDIDDAISLHCINEPILKDIFKETTFQEHMCVIGIHITDVAALLKNTPDILDWAKNRASSSYFFKNDELQSIPMLPHSLAHGTLSLNENEERDAISLFILIENKTKIIDIKHKFTIISNKKAIHYDQFEVTEPFISFCHTNDPEEIVASLMIEYNKYFGNLFAMQSKKAIIRVQKEDEPAKYSFADTKCSHLHHGLQIYNYAHMTSPIRRFADLYNQCILHSKYTEIDIDSLNETMTKVQEFHKKSNLSHLAYKCQENPIICKCNTAIIEGDKCIAVKINKRKITIPFFDSYYAEAISHIFQQNNEVEIEIFGILDQGFLKLRMRPISSELKMHVAEFDDQVYNYCQKWNIPHAKKLAQSGMGIQIMKIMDMNAWMESIHCSEEVALELINAFSFTTTQTSDVDFNSELQISEINRILGYPIDNFQNQCLEIIKQTGSDLIAMAPTGSGKTAVALIAIMQAFKNNKKAVYTSPIKALSNQKYGEFTEWFRERNIDATVTLLTGDIRIRGNPNSKYHLIICTSEIMRNKLSNCGVIDEDMENIGCLVSDEVHYINDANRGNVWEETIVQLPQDVQLVALSATLKYPEKFSGWISSIRKRPISLIRRNDRHVPLHIGGFKNGKFVEYYGTHGEKAGIFLQDFFLETEKREKILARTSTTAQMHHQARQKEKEDSGRKHKDYYRKKEASSTYSFGSECIRLVKQLKSCSMLPSIIFCMSRKKCMEGAMNLMSYSIIDTEEKKKISSSIRIMEKRFLAKYADLKTLSIYSEFMHLLHNGIGYHHSGMFPVLREFVELCFQQKLIKVVFATETLGVGVNMPARSVVFSQLDKPTGQESSKRLLHTDEFWQMAGRAGRRGMDSIGYVIYDPFLLQSKTSALEMKEILTGSLPLVKSKLIVNNAFVLRMLNNLCDSTVLQKTLLFTQNQQEFSQLQQELNEKPSITSEMELYFKLNNQLKGELNGGTFISLSNKAKKQIEEKIFELEQNTNGIKDTLILVQERYALQSQINSRELMLQKQWDNCHHWLSENGFIDSGLTPRGKCCALFADGEPIIMGTIISDGWFADPKVTKFDIYAWTSLFLQDWKGTFPYETGSYFKEILNETSFLAEMVEFELNTQFANVIYSWSIEKNIQRLMEMMDPHMIGSFIKGVMRVASQVEIIRKALLGLMMYDAHSKLDNFMTDLLGGIVTNESLYIQT